MRPRGKGVPEGPFRVDQIPEGDYELSNGHPVYCGPTGGSGSRGNGVGYEVLATDPAVESAGVDTGFALSDKTVRAPDVAIGNVPDAPGWVRGAPPLAVEYAGTGQDEGELQAKISELLGAGTRWIWVVRLVGPRRVEVYERDRPVRMFGPGEELVAPGVLKNPVPIEALFEPAVAHKLALRNLLQREGYASLDDVQAAGERAGLVEAIESLCAVLDIPITDERRAEMARLDVPGMRALVARLRTDRRWP